jgi:ATP-binding protein involved in chromosome partitioning
VIGGVENMSGLLCPTCHTAIDVFSPVAHHRSIWAAGVERVASIPIDPAVAGSDGTPLLVAEPTSPAAHAFIALAAQVRTWAAGRYGMPGATTPPS